MTNYKLHKLPKEGFIITSDEEIKEGDLQWFPFNNNIKTASEEQGIHPDCKKVVAQQDQIDFTFLSEEDQKKIGWYNIEQFAHEVLIKWGIFSGSLHTGIRDGFVEGFQKAVELLSDRVFTMEDMDKAFKQGLNSTSYLLSQQKSWDIEIEKVTFFSKLSSSVQPILTNGKIKILKLL